MFVGIFRTQILIYALCLCGHFDRQVVRCTSMTFDQIVDQSDALVSLCQPQKC
jgi:hypothetical protein